MKRKRASAQPVDLIAWDQAQATDRIFPEGENSHITAYLSHFKEWNAKKSEANLLSGELHPILKLRALIFRGRHAEAEEVLHELDGMQLAPQELAEGLMQKARLASMRGQWTLCKELAAAASQGQVTPLMRLTLYQVEALACYELGEFSHAQKLLGRAESLSTAFPNCTSAIYYRLIQIKIAARQTGPALAIESLRGLWLEMLDQKGLDLNLAQALLRAEIDLRRLSGMPHESYALASLWIAEQMGENLYIALAVFDCFHAFAPASVDRDYFKTRLESAAVEFERIRGMIAEMDGLTAITSTSVEAVQIYAGLPPARESSQQERRQGIDTIALPGLNALLNLRSGVCQDLKRYPQLSAVLDAFKSGEPLSKIDFFRIIWGNQKYVPHLHDQLIFGIQQRLKNKLGLRLVSDEFGLSIKGLYVVR